MKPTVNVSEKEYCYHVCVIDYALYTGKGKVVVKKTSEISKIVGVSKRTLQFSDQREFINLEFLIFWRMGIIESPLLKRDISANKVNKPAVLLVKILNYRK